MNCVGKPSRWRSVKCDPFPVNYSACMAASKRANGLPVGDNRPGHWPCEEKVMGVTSFEGGPVVVHGPGQVIRVRYTNWRGETAVRNILPLRMYWGSNLYHTTPQWLLECVDMEKGVNRDFAMAGITEWGVKESGDV